MFLTKLFGLLRGIGPMTYIIAGLVGIMLTLSSMVWLRGQTIEDLQVRISKAEQFATQCVQINRQNYQVFKEMEDALKRCSGMRSAAEDRGNRAVEELARVRREAYMASTETKEKVNEAIAENPDTSCSNVPLPPRATELLVAAAHSANGD